jgi:hypothetical protein
VFQFRICTNNEEKTGEKKDDAEKMFRTGSGHHRDKEGCNVANQSREKSISSNGGIGYFRHEDYLHMKDLVFPSGIVLMSFVFSKTFITQEQSF